MLNSLFILNSCIIIIFVSIISTKYLSKTILMIFFFSFSQGVLELSGVPTIVPRLLLELAILILFVKTLYLSRNNNVSIRYKWGALMLLIFIVSIISAIINQTPLISFLLFTRHVFIFYLMFIAIYNSNMSYNDIRKINNWLIVLFIIQIFAAIIKFVAYGGEIVEGGGIGTVSVRGGSLALLIPLIPISFLFSKYIYTKKPINLLLIPLFLIIAFVSGKRSTGFIVPLLFIMLTITYLVASKNFNFIRMIKYGFGITIISIFTLYITSQTSSYLNPLGSRFSGAFDLIYMLNQMTSYLFDFDPVNPGAGRIASFGIVYDLVKNINFMNILFGLGPGKLIGSFLLESSNSIFDLDLPYGARSGILWFFIQIGLIGSFFYLFFIISLLKNIYLKLKTNEQYLDLSPTLLGIVGCIIIFLFDFLIYSSSFITSGVTMPVLLYLLAIYLSPKPAVKIF